MVCACFELRLHLSFNTLFTFFQSASFVIQSVSESNRIKIYLLFKNPLSLGFREELCRILQEDPGLEPRDALVVVPFKKLGTGELLVDYSVRAICRRL